MSIKDTSTQSSESRELKKLGIKPFLRPNALAGTDAIEEAP